VVRHLARQILSPAAAAKWRYGDSSLTPDNQPQPVLLPQLEQV
jgi:hypothetical protein